MFNTKMFIEGFKLTFIPTYAIAMLAIACQFMAWEIGYLPAMLSWYLAVMLGTVGPLSGPRNSWRKSSTRVRRKGESPSFFVRSA